MKKKSVTSTAIAGFFAFAIILAISSLVVNAFPILRALGDGILAIIIYSLAGGCVVYLVKRLILTGKAETDTRTPEEKYPSIPYDEWVKQEAQRLKVKKVNAAAAEQSSKEVQEYRERFAPDINVILGAVHGTWRWASPTACRIYVQFEGNPDGIFEGLLDIKDNRVVSISVGGETYKNIPLEEAKKKERQEAKDKAKAEAEAKLAKFAAALAEFFATRKDGKRVVFSKLEPDKGTFILTGPVGKGKVENAKAKAEYGHDGKIASVELAVNGKKKTIKRGKQDSSGSNAVPTKPVVVQEPPKEPVPKPGAKVPPTPTPPPEVAPVPAPGPAPVASAPKPEPAPAAANTAEKRVNTKARPEHAAPIDIHQPSGLSREAIERNAALYADDAANLVNTAAVTAYNEGRSFFEVPWPEGLLTLEELEIYSELLTKGSNNLKRCEILEETQCFRIYLDSETPSNEAHGLVAVAEEMIPALEKSAAQLYYEEGEQWLSIPWPDEVYCQKDAEEFGALVCSKSNFDSYKVETTETGDGRILLHSSGDDDDFTCE